MSAIAILIVILVFFYFNQKIKILKEELNHLRYKVNQLQKQTIENTVEAIIEKKETNQEKVTRINTERTLSSINTQVIESFEKEENEIQPQESLLSINFKKLTAFVQENFLTIIGIVTLVLGIGYFVKYAIDKNWINETFRVLIGISTGLIIIGIGHYLRKQYKIFSSILVGGGLSVLYFTITIAFREYHLVNQTYTFILLAFVTLLSIILSFIYNQQSLIIFSLLGGFAAPLMVSTGQKNYEFLFSYLAILNLAMLWITWRKNWQNIGYISFVLTQLYFASWINDITSKSIFLFIGLNFIIYTLFSLIPIIKNENVTKPHQFLFNINIAVTAILGYIAYENYYTEFLSLVPVILSVILICFYFLFREKSNSFANTSIALAIALITISIGIEFDITTITSLWAIESSLLLFLWKNTKDKIFKYCFIGLIPVFIGSLITNWAYYISGNENYALLLNPIFATSCIVFICSIINIYIIKEFNNTEKFLGLEIKNAKTIFSITSILFIYFGLLFEIIYQSEKHFDYNIQIGITFLYTIYFLSVILFINKLFNINTKTKYAIGLMSYGLIFIYPMIVNISYEIVIVNQPIYFYFIYLLYLIPFIYFFIKFIKNEEFSSIRSIPSSLWVCFVVIVTVISIECYNAYQIVFRTNIDYGIYNHHKDIYIMTILPIIWSILGFGLIYKAFKQNHKTILIMGFVLFGLIVSKLYLIDVWRMSNELRIVSFIVLGILILITSFMYQKLKKMMNTIFNKEE